MATKTKPKKRAKKKYLPGMEPPSIPKIEKAADEYREIRDMRMEYTKCEVEKQGILLKLMKDNGLTNYEYDGFKVEVIDNPKVKVRSTGEESNGDEMDNEAKAVVTKTAEAMKSEESATCLT